MDGMTSSSSETGGEEDGDRPTVTIVFLVYDRRDELRTSLRKMLVESDYDSDKVDVIVVDNASTDGSAAMVEEEFPQVRLIRRETNSGVSGWNDGFAVARGDYVLALDDDCYLPPDGLRRTIAAAREHDADLVSFKVISTADPDFVFSAKYRTGLFMFWGCAVLVRRQPLQQLEGYDPEIFVWANELEFMIRFFDRGYRHLHLPDVIAQHMKAPSTDAGTWIDERGYRINARHWGYIAAKLLRRRDAAEALIALLARDIRDGLRVDRVALKAVPDTLKGFVHGLRHRAPVHKPELSRFYRRNFETFASPWWLARPVGQLVRGLPSELPTRGRGRPTGRRDEYYAERARYYPEEPATLQF
jgi:GT2 family glycosyltransferase